MDSPIRIFHGDSSQFQRGTVHEEGQGWQDGNETHDPSNERHPSTFDLGKEDDECSGDHTSPARWDGCTWKESNKWVSV